MIRKLSIFLMAVIAVVSLSSCGKNGKDAAREQCNCLMTILNKKVTDMSKFHDEIRKCRQDFSEKYDKKIQQDPEFRKEFETERNVCMQQVQKKIEELSGGH